MIKRPFLIIVLGYIIGIIIGLYFNKSIVFLYLVIFILIYVINKIKKINSKKINSNKLNKLISYKRYKRYINLILTKTTILILIISSIISNTIVIIKNKRFNTIYKDTQNIKGTAIVTKEIEKKQYNDQTEIKIIEGNKKEYKNTKLIIKYTTKEKLNYGDLIEIEGKYIKPQGRRNYKGFNYKEYLKQENIYGTIKANKIKKLNINKGNLIKKKTNEIKNKIKKILENNLEEKNSQIAKGLILGENKNIDENIKEQFRICNISHILAVSGMHIGILILGIGKILQKIIGKRKTNYILIVTIIFYTYITGLTPSIIRASLMAIVIIISKITKRQNDNWNSLGICLLITLIMNPYKLQNIGLIYSYVCVISIYLIYNDLRKLINKQLEKRKEKINKRIYIKTEIHEIKEKEKIDKKERIEKEKILYRIKNRIKDIIKNNRIIKQIKIYIKKSIILTISIQILILPIQVYSNNIISPYFLISNILEGILIGPTLISLIIAIIINVIFEKCNKVFIIANYLIEKIIKISEISKLPFAKIYIPTPNIKVIIIYYLIVINLIILNKIYSNKKGKERETNKRIKNIIQLLKYKYKERKRKDKNRNRNKPKPKKTIIVIITIIIVSITIKITTQKLKIHMVDVGQGDCTFIETASGQTILIDGGGKKEQDIGKKTLLPYILDRGYTKIDYIFVTHFDTDHIGGLLPIMEELKVNKVCISKQPKDSKNYQKFLEIVKKKKIKVLYLKAGDRIKIEKNLYLNMLWPTEENIEQDKSLNNNSLVFNLKYKKINIIFTGDIEKEAEYKIIENIEKENKENKNINIEALILKVPHHGSNTSSTEKFLDNIKPKIAIIGVGENNIFGHPSEKTINKLIKRNIKIYRTDTNGEITIEVKENKMKVKTMIK